MPKPASSTCGLFRFPIIEQGTRPSSSSLKLDSEVIRVK